MGFSAGDTPVQTGVSLARPLYRDDDDGMQALRLQHLLTTDPEIADRQKLIERMERAISVTGARWAALLLGGERGVEVLVSGDIPPSIHRQLGEVRLRAGETVSFPTHLINRAASQGYAVEGAVLAGIEGPQGHVVLGFPLAERGARRRTELVRLVADDLSGLLQTSALMAQSERIRSHLSLVHRLGQQVTSIHNRAELFEEITRLIHRSLGYEHIQLLLVDEAAGSTDLVHASGPFAEQLMAAGFSETIGRGIIGRVAETGRIRISADVTQDTHFVSHAMLPNTASELALPLRLGQRVIGVLDIQSDRRDAFRRDDVILLQTIADQIAPAIEQNRLFAAERQERELADTLADVSRIISSSLDPSHVLEAVLKELGRVVPHRGCRVTLLGEDGLMRVVAAKGYPDDALVRSVVFRPEDAPLSAPVLRDHRTLIIGDVRTQLDWVWQPGTGQVRSWCSAPLVLGDDCIGWLCIDWPEPDFYSTEHGRVVRTFADQAVVAIGNARLFARATELSEALEQKVASRTAQLQDARDEIAHKAHELQALLRRLVGVQEEERRRIAYDLHDSVAQSILASTYELQALRRRVVDPEFDQRLTQCQRMLDTTLQEMKQIIYALRPTVLDELGLIPALENYLSSLPASVSLATDISVSGTPFALGPEADLAVYRIVQEACQNAVRHAGAERLELLLDFASTRLEVSIRDDGCGFALDAAEQGLGLVGIRERANAVGGEVSIDSRPGQGTNIIIGVPGGSAAH
jgi:signal transduction histidine kinase